VAAPSNGALTAAGYTQAPTGLWTNTFGAITVVFDLRGEPDMGLLTVTPSGDVAAADITSASNSLSGLGYPLLAASAPGGNQEDLGAVGGLVSYSISL
jgi:hypothetical protein